MPFIDLGERIAARYDELGSEAIDPLFADPHTHTSLDGAKLNAEVVAQGLAELVAAPLAPYFKP